MNVQAIINDINRQFVQMRKLRELFVSIMGGDAPPAERPGRPKGPSNKATEKGAMAPKKATRPGKRTMSAEAKVRIAAAQKRAQEPATRKYAAKPKAAKKTAAKAKKTTAPEAQPASETTTADA